MNVLIVSPDVERRVACADALRSYGYNIDKEPSIAEATANLESRRSDRMRAQLVVLCALKVPELTAALATLAAHPILSEARVLVVQEGLDPDHMARLLDLGADDVYQRPFVPAIYAARVRGLLRRPKAEPAKEDPSQVLRFGLGLRIQLLERRVIVDGKSVNLGRGQFDLLVHLVQAATQACEPAELRQVLARTLLYATPEKLVAELSAVRDGLGRYGAGLEIGKDGAACLREMSPPASGAI